jgi:hypothetical protein
VEHEPVRCQLRGNFIRIAQKEIATHCASLPFCVMVIRTFSANPTTITSVETSLTRPVVRLVVAGYPVLTTESIVRRKKAISRQEGYQG